MIVTRLFPLLLFVNLIRAAFESFSHSFLVSYIRLTSTYGFALKVKTVIVVFVYVFWIRFLHLNAHNRNYFMETIGNRRHMAHVDLLARQQYLKCLNIYSNNVFVVGLAVESKPYRDYSRSVAGSKPHLCAVRKAPKYLCVRIQCTV